MVILDRDLQFPSFGVVGFKLLENLSSNVLLSYGGTQQKGGTKCVHSHILVYAVF